MNTDLNLDLEQRFEQFCNHGDTQALAEVFDEAAPVLGRVAGHLSTSQPMAEDLLQETFLAALESADRYDARRPLMPWLLAIMFNRAKRTMQAKSRSPDLHRLAQAQGVPKDSAPPDDKIMAAEFEQAVGQAISSLPEPYREVLELHLQKSQEPLQVAKNLGRTASTIRTQIQRGLGMLRRGLPASFAPAALPIASFDQIRTQILERASSSASPGLESEEARRLDDHLPKSSSIHPIKALLGHKASLVTVAVILAGVRVWQILPTFADPIERGQEVPEGDTHLASSISGPPDGSTSAPRRRVVRAAKPALPNLVSQVGDLRLHPVVVHDGPLLFRVTRGDTKDSHDRRHSVFAPASGMPAEVFLETSHNLKILRRIDHNRILIKHHGDPYGLIAVDLAAAQTTQILKKTNNELLSIQGERVLFLVNVVASGFGFRTEMTPAPDGSQFLWSWNLDGKRAAQQVLEFPIAKHWRMPDGKIVVLSAVEPGAYWRIDPNGNAHSRLLSLPSEMPPHRVQLSPNGQQLAIGLGARDRQTLAISVVAPKPGKPEQVKTRGFSLLVFDVATGKLSSEVSGINCDIFWGSSSSPRLEFIWLDDERIRFSESVDPTASATDKPVTDSGFTRSLNPQFHFVDLEVSTGRRLKSTQYSTGGLSHSVPPQGQVRPFDPTMRRNHGLFDQVTTRVYYHGKPDVLLDTSSDWDWPRYSPNGRFFVITRPKPTWQAALFDGKAMTKQTIDEWCYELTWLPPEIRQNKR